MALLQMGTGAMNLTDDIQPRKSRDMLPSKPIIRGCSNERASELLIGFHTRVSNRRVSRYWIESEEELDLYVANLARKPRSTKVCS